MFGKENKIVDIRTGWKGRFPKDKRDSIPTPEGYRQGHRLIRIAGEVPATVLGRLRLSEKSYRNILKAQELWLSGMEAWIMPKHESDADGPLVGPTLRRVSREFESAMFLLMGEKILAKRIRGFFAKNWPQIYTRQVSTPNHKANLSDITQSEELISTLLKAGKVAMVFPEGTRSDTGKLGDGIPLLAHYLSDNAFVLPMAFDGSRERWPKEGKPKWIRGRAIVAYVGEPILIKDLRREIAEFARASGEEILYKEEKALIMDLIMRRGIAPLIQNEDDKGNYKDRNLPLSEILKQVRERFACETAAKRKAVLARRALANTG